LPWLGRQILAACRSDAHRSQPAGCHGMPRKRKRRPVNDGPRVRSLDESGLCLPVGWRPDSLPVPLIFSERAMPVSSAAETIDIRVGHSPDPDDAFMFHALANDKLDTGRYRFTHVMQDIETLNRRALNAEL